MKFIFLLRKPCLKFFITNPFSLELLMSMRSVPFQIILTFLVIPVLFASCRKEEYDLRQGVDMDMNVGGEALSFPLGTSEKFTLRTLLKDEDLLKVLVEDESGNYVLRPDGYTYKMDLSSLPATDFSIEDIEAEASFSLSGEKSLSGSKLDEQIYVVDFSVPFLVEFPAIPQEVKSLEEVGLDGSALELGFVFPELPAGLTLEQLKPDLEIVIPDELQVVDGTNRLLTVKVDAFNTEEGYRNTFRLESFHMESFHREGERWWTNPSVIVRGSLKVSSSGISNSEVFMSEVLKPKVSLAIRKINPVSLKGRMALKTPVYQHDFEFGSAIPDLNSGEVCLDFYNPHLSVGFTRADFPLLSSIRLVPGMGNHWFEEKALDLDLKIASTSVSGDKQNFWIGENPQGIPYGYEYVKADLAGLVERLPEYVNTQVQMSVDSLQTMVYRLGQETVVEGDMRLEVPLVFDKNFYVVLRDTLTLSHGNEVKQVSGRDVVVLGKVFNRFPLAVDMKIIGLDNDYNPVLESEAQTISASLDGKESVSDLEFDFSDEGNILRNRGLSSVVIEMTCRVAQGNERASVNASDYLQVKASIRIPGGIRVSDGKITR